VTSSSVRPEGERPNPLVEVDNRLHWEIDAAPRPREEMVDDHDGLKHYGNVALAPAYVKSA
jgi:hypothetical protein